MKPCVIIPAFDTPRTLGAVAREVSGLCPHVIVVDDGSAEPATAHLRGIEGIAVIRHPRNLGKGAALRSGFEAARGMGFTHAVTIDSDGQHLPADLPAMLDAARRNPGAIVLGNRDLRAAGAGMGSKAGRLNSNFWTWVETGLRLPDTQSGFRVYPLDDLAPLRLAADGYDFEIEVLVKAAWAGVPVVSVPIGVRYFRGAERVSHFRPLADFLRVARLNARLVALRICLPAPYLRLLCLRRFADLPLRRRVRETFVELFVREPGSPGRIAASVGLGLFMGIAPVWGFQIVLTLLAAHATRLSKPVAVLASNISFPLMIPFILVASLYLGRLALGVDPGLPSPASLHLTPHDLPAWIAGSLLLGAMSAVLGAALTWALVTAARRWRRRGTA